MRSSLVLILFAAFTFLALGVFAQTGMPPGSGPTGLGGAGPGTPDIPTPGTAGMGGVGGFGGTGGFGGAGGFGTGGSGGGFASPIFPDGGITRR